MGLADIFVARDGDATTDGLLIVVIFFTFALAVMGVACWWQRQRLRHVEQRAATDRAGLQQVAAVDARERQLEGVVYDLRGRILTNWGRPDDGQRQRAELKKMMKGGAA